MQHTYMRKINPLVCRDSAEISLPRWEKKTIRPRMFSIPAPCRESAAPLSPTYANSSELVPTKPKVRAAPSSSSWLKNPEPAGSLKPYSRWARRSQLVGNAKVRLWVPSSDAEHGLRRFRSFPRLATAKVVRVFGVLAPRRTDKYINS